MLHSNLSVNTQGHLAIAGVDTVMLAEKYGTPLYVMDEARIRERCALYVDQIKRFFPAGSMPLLASKALCCKKIYAIASEYDMGTDLVSGGELYTARAAGFPLHRAFFHGNNKTDADIAFAIDCKIGYFVVDNAEELQKINEYAQSQGIVQKILLRLSPGIDPHTHAKIATGQVDSKFGSAIETGDAEKMVRLALSLSSISLCGFHCHVGSQIFDIAPFTDAADIMLDFIAQMKEVCGYEAKLLNLGGGFGVRYTESDPQISIERNLQEIAAHYEQKCRENNITPPAVLMEPGRSIVADAGLTLYTVGSVKQITGYKNYVSIDGGMPDNPRYALYQSKYTILNADRPEDPADFVCTVAGRCCESGDLIGEEISLAKPVRGEHLAVLVTGAYNHSMASNYNRLPRPAMVFVKDGEDSLAVRRETFADLVALDV